jgi:hypothetical protein
MTFATFLLKTLAPTVKAGKILFPAGFLETAKEKI